MAAKTVAFRSNKRVRTRLQPKRHKSGRREKGEDRNSDDTMTESAVVSLMGRMIESAMNDEDGDISETRKTNFNYYMGADYGNERDGYSKFVTREVAETIEWVMPNVLRVFVAGDKIMAFDPEGPEDEDTAKQETEITHHFIRKANNGNSFLALHHWTKDALLYPTSYLKCHMEERETTDVGTMTGLTPLAVQMVDENPEQEILEQRSYNDFVLDRETGQHTPMEVFDLKVRTTKKRQDMRLDPVPGEECLVSGDLTTLDLDESTFVCHRVRKSFTQLVEMGYDADMLDDVGGFGDENTWNDERVNRLFFDDEDPNETDDQYDDSMRKFWVHECYVWFDHDGKGTAQFRKVVLIGDKVFENEETNYQPMIAMSAILMAHKHTGMSYVDLIKDLQLLQSTLTRQLLDNIYKINIRKKYFDEDGLTDDGSTMEAMLNPQAEYVPVRGNPAMRVLPEQSQSIVQELLPVMQNVAESRSMRSGVVPESNINPDILQEGKTGVFLGALEQASMRVEMLVRIFAETGFRKLALKVHQLVRSHWDVPAAVRIRNEWIDVDPSGWRDRYDLTVNVGLGFNNKQQMLMLLKELLGIQKEALPMGLADGEKIYNTLEKLINASSVGDVRMFFNDPTSPNFKAPQPQPSPEQIMAEAQSKALDSESQRKGFETQNKVQQDGAKIAADVRNKEADAAGKHQDRQIKLRELALREYELEKKYGMAEDELASRIDNLDADTKLKSAQTVKTRLEAIESGVNASEMVSEARSIMDDFNEGGSNGDEEQSAVEVEL